MLCSWCIALMSLLSDNGSQALHACIYSFVNASIIMIARLFLWPCIIKGRQKVNYCNNFEAALMLLPCYGYFSYFSAHVFCLTAVSGSSVPEWIEFVVVWLPTSNGFLNCIFYFWINQSFRRKFHLVIQRLALAICPELADTIECCRASKTQFVSAIPDNNNTVHERSSSVSSTCTLLSMA